MMALHARESLSLETRMTPRFGEGRVSAVLTNTLVSQGKVVSFEALCAGFPQGQLIGLTNLSDRRGKGLIVP